MGFRGWGLGFAVLDVKFSGKGIQALVRDIWVEQGSPHYPYMVGFRVQGLRV